MAVYLAALLSAPVELAAATFSNPTSVTIPAGPATGNPNPASVASVYPSQITVVGEVGTISKITVTLNNLSHNFPDDIDMLLVGPSGAAFVFFGDVGGPTAVAGLTITLDDAAASQLPGAGPLVSG